jgi:hypothetical protein
MAKNKVAQLVLAVLLLSLPLFGQYSAGTTGGVQDVTSSCATMNCFNLINNNGLVGLTSMAISPDMAAFAGLDSSYNYWVYDFSTLTWAENNWWNMGGNIRGVTFVNSTTAYAISNATNYNVFSSSNGSAWASMGVGYCSALASDYQGDLFCLDENSHVEQRDFANNTWTQLGTTTLANIAASDSGLVGVGTNGHLWGWNGTAWQDNGAPPFTPRQAPNTIAASEDFTVAVIDTTGNIHISRDGGQTWTTVQGVANNVAMASGIYLFVSNVNGVGHYTGIAPSITQTTTGSYGGCPGCNPPGYHTGAASVSFPHGLNQGATQVQTPYSDQMLASHADYSPSCDPIFTYNDAECNAATYSTVTCPVMGSLLYVSQSTPYGYFVKQAAKYKVTSTAGGGNYWLTGVPYKIFYVTPWCTGGLTPFITTITVPGFKRSYATYYYTLTTWNKIAPGYYNLVWSFGLSTSDVTQWSGCQSNP